ncbi:MAG: MmcQ/YjbR family DNA-binding protein [Clostridia bacterium]|nr:MmcQ/YjbR family DNA-binding protein [Clostridia bacterium]
MTDFEKLFSQGEANQEKLLKNGFIKTESGYYRESPLMDFLLRTTVTEDGKVNAELFDPEADAPYTLHLVSGAEGSFVGEVRKAYENALLEIAEACFDRAVFKSKYAKNLLEYAEEKYGERCEYLWEKFPENGVLRRADNRKWYAAILTTNGNKVGLSTDNIVEIVDLRAEEVEVQRLIHSRGFAPAWHMNKKSWITVLLDGSVELSTIKEMVDKSRSLALK